MDYSYIINQLGENRENYFNSIAPPIIQTSNFAFDSVEKMREGFSNEINNYCYTRGKNPTTEILEKKMAALEESEDALIVSSGVSAISLSIISNLKAGDHIVCVKDPYSWTNKLLNKLLARFNITVSMVDGTDPKNYEKEITENTKIFYMETPNSFTFELQDIEEICKIAKKNNIITIVDNSYSSFLNQKPIKLGADIVIYSASKYIGGHSDVVAGIICSSKKMIEQIFYNKYMNFGNIISPNDSWLLIRGLRTLEMRLERVSKTALKVIEFLKNHEKVEKIIYPFDIDFPQYELAKKQMKSATGLFTVKFKFKDRKEAEIFSNSLKRFILAVSWGGYESLILPTCAFPDTNIPFDLIRFYTGFEAPEVLIDDLKNAFKKLS